MPKTAIKLNNDHRDTNKLLFRIWQSLRRRCKWVFKIFKQQRRGQRNSFAQKAKTDERNTIWPFGVALALYTLHLRIYSNIVYLYSANILADCKYTVCFIFTPFRVNRHIIYLHSTRKLSWVQIDNMAKCTLHLMPCRDSEMQFKFEKRLDGHSKIHNPISKDKCSFHNDPSNFKIQNVHSKFWCLFF